MAGRIPIAYLAGVVSVVFPCVLPLVPGYLSAVTAVEASRLGTPGTAMRVVRGTLPFFAGFTTVFVLLGVGAVAIAEQIGIRTQAWVAGFILVVFGLSFMGLLPLPKRLVGAGLLQRARGSGSSAFLLAGLAFTRAMTAFRWLRDRYVYVQAVCGASLVVLGLLLFFDRYYWLQVLMNRALDRAGIDSL